MHSLIQDDQDKPTSRLNSSDLVLDDSFSSNNLSQSIVSESGEALDSSFDIGTDEVGKVCNVKPR